MNLKNYGILVGIICLLSSLAGCGMFYLNKPLLVIICGVISIIPAFLVIVESGGDTTGISMKLLLSILLGYIGGKILQHHSGRFIIGFFLGLCVYYTVVALIAIVSGRLTEK